MSDMELTGLALRMLTEAECKRAVADKEAHIAEWESIGYTFIASVKNLAIVRAGAMGGDRYDVHGGWKYATPFGMWKEWAEIKAVSVAFTKHKRTAPPVTRPNPSSN